jgi:hypothetical protein
MGRRQNVYQKIIRTPPHNIPEQYHITFPTIHNTTSLWHTIQWLKIRVLILSLTHIRTTTSVVPTKMHYFINHQNTIQWVGKGLVPFRTYSQPSFPFYISVPFPPLQHHAIQQFENADFHFVIKYAKDNDKRCPYKK